MDKLGLPAKYAGSADWGKLIKDEFEEYTQVVKDLKLK